MQYDIKIDNTEEYIVIDKETNKYKINTKIKIKNLKQYLKVANEGECKKAFYELIDSENINKDVIEDDDKAKIILSIISNNNLEQFYDKFSSIDDIDKRLYETINLYQVDLAENVNKTINSAFYSLGKLLVEANKIDFSSILESINKSICDFQSNITKILPTLKIKGYSEKEIENIRKSNEKWAEFRVDCYT